MTCFGEELGRKVAPHVGAVGNGTCSRAGQRLGSVGAEDFASQRQPVTFQLGKSRDGRFAGPVEGGEKGALGGKPVPCRRVVDGRQHLGRARIVLPALDADGALRDGRKHFGRLYGRGGDVRHAQPVQPGHGKEGAGRDAVFEFLQSGLHIPPEFDDVEIGTAVQKLRLASEAGRADTRSGFQIGQGPATRGHEGVADVFAREVAIEHQPAGLVHRHVLHRVDGDVDLFGEHRLFDLTGEQPLAADLFQGAVEDAVTGCLDDDNLEGLFRQVESCRQAVAGFMGLSKREGRTSGADTKGMRGIWSCVHMLGVEVSGKVDNRSIDKFALCCDQDGHRIPGNTIMKDKLILRALAGETLPVPPIWMMRQAGRYLPEYRATRAQAGDFLSLCYNPELAAEVTLQPIRRYGFDAAILFADILLIPDALGMDLWFVTGEGPRLSTLTSAEDVAGLKPADVIHDHLAPVYETVRILSRELPEETTLIGFAGAPWTVATYMIAGRGTKDQGPAHALKAENREVFDAILARVTEATIEYLCAQIDAGAEVVKLFDSWAGSLKGQDFDDYALKPAKEIIAAVKARHPDIPVIAFPREAGDRYIGFAKATGADCVALDNSVSAAWAAEHVQKDGCVQGNLASSHMVTGGEDLVRETREIVDAFSGGPHIFNLGHGITPDADPENVQLMIDTVRSGG